VSVGDLIESRPDIRDGRPFIAGTGVTVGRIGVLWNQGRSVEQIVEDVYDGHLTNAQIHAALAMYLANRPQFDADLAAQDDATDRAAENWYATHPRV
jgi:uncharacterized protein (DUF433 family)